MNVQPSTHPERVVMTIPEAGARLGLGRSAAYEAARRGEIPTIQFGRLKRGPIVAFDRMLGGGEAA